VPQTNIEPGKRPGSVASQLAMVIELPFALIISTLLGGGIGYLLDRWWHTGPAFMLVGGLLGAAAGMRDVIRRLSRADKKTRGGDGKG